MTLEGSVENYINLGYSNLGHMTSIFIVILPLYSLNLTIVTINPKVQYDLLFLKVHILCQVIE